MISHQLGQLGSHARDKCPRLVAFFDRTIQKQQRYIDTNRSALACSAFSAAFLGMVAAGVETVQSPAQEITSVQYNAKQADIPEDLLMAMGGEAALFAQVATQTIAPVVAALTPDAMIEGPLIEPRYLFSPRPIKPQTPTRKEQTVTVKRGDTLTDVLVNVGLTGQDAYTVVSALKPKFDPRKIRAGQDIELTLQVRPESRFASSGSEDFAPKLVALSMKTDIDRHVEVRRDQDGSYIAEDVEVELTKSFKRARAKINTNLFLAAQEIGIPLPIIVKFIRMYSYDVDFQREIRAGDTLEVFYSEFMDDDGNVIKSGDIHYGNLILRGKENAYYRYTTPDDGLTDYYDANGQSAKKFLMKTPVDGARLSSGFGYRRHPISGYRKKHKGTDFAAPRGTPIMAAGKGVVERASRYGGYGKYIRIRHSNGYKTAYAHLNGYAKGIKSGTRVRQGQIIGYVGSTGNSTGPHLHYEVLVNGKQVNPMSIKVPTGRKLSGTVLAKFRAERSKVDTQMAALPLITRIDTAQLDQ